jgi:putative tryptophan/tyrosine transport system substrate-binding protein
VNRRELIGVLCGAASLPPVATRAQQPAASPVIGFLHSASPGPAVENLATFRQTLRAAGYVEGQNLAIEYRWAESRYERLPALAGDLVARGVSVIVAAGASDGPLAVKRATSTIPIIFAIGGDPIRAGLVASLNPRRGNVTGVTFFSVPLGPKRLELLHEMVPRTASVALLANPDNVNAASEQVAVAAAARAVALEFRVVHASSEAQIEAAFATLVEQRIGGLIVSTDALFNSRIEHLVALASRHGIPTMYFLRQFVSAGGLVSYGASITDMYRQVGDYASRILKGASPAELPVLQPTRFELVINRATARTLGLSVPPALVALADEVIG